MSESFTINYIDGQPVSITCHFCGLESNHRDDIRERYCANCHIWHDEFDREAEITVRPNGRKA